MARESLNPVRAPFAFSDPAAPLVRGRIVFGDLIMKWIKSLSRKLVAYFSGRASQDVSAAIELIALALPIVERIAALTPIRSDDEIVRLFRDYTIPQAETWLALPREQRGRALLQVAAIQLKRLTPDAADRIIDLAVQLAVVQFRAERGQGR
jgi:hypothetical protein